MAGGQEEFRPPQAIPHVFQGQLLPQMENDISPIGDPRSERLVDRGFQPLQVRSPEGRNLEAGPPAQPVDLPTGGGKIGILLTSVLNRIYYKVS